MKAVSSKLFSAAAKAFFFVIAAAVIFAFPITSNAQTGTLGTESPKIYCRYYQDGEEVDGNKLTAGTYDVTFAVSGVENISTIEITAAYTDAVTIADTPVALLTDSVENMQSMGYLIGGGEMVFGFVSTNDDTSPVNKQETVIATVTATFANDCDAEDVISLETSPKFTFLQVDYGDGYEDSYALDIYAESNGSLYPMTCDISPEFGFTVSGSIVVMTDYTGKTAGNAAYGNYTIDIYADEERTNLVTSVTSVYDNSESVVQNLFTTNRLPSGTYYATVSYEYALTRTDVTINVNGADISGAVIPVMACDFDKSSNISLMDTRKLMAAAAEDDKVPFAYCDLNADGSLSLLDTRVVMACAADTAAYPPLVIE